MKFILKESELPANFVLMAQKENIIWDPVNVEKFYTGLISAMSEFLSIHKKTDSKTALVIKDIKGDFRMAAIISYHETEDDNKDDDTINPNNWYLAFTFNEEDLFDVENINSVNDLTFQTIFVNCLHSLHGIRFTFPQYIYPLIVAAANTLIDWLDSNAKADEIVELECEGYFVANVMIENDIKVMSLTPSGEIKRVIKDN